MFLACRSKSGAASFFRCLPGGGEGDHNRLHNRHGNEHHDLPQQRNGEQSVQRLRQGISRKAEGEEIIGALKYGCPQKQIDQVGDHGRAQQQGKRPDQVFIPGAVAADDHHACGKEQHQKMEPPVANPKGREERHAGKVGIRENQRNDGAEGAVEESIGFQRAAIRQHGHRHKDAVDIAQIQGQFIPDMKIGGVFPRQAEFIHRQIQERKDPQIPQELLPGFFLPDPKPRRGNRRYSRRQHGEPQGIENCDHFCIPLFFSNRAKTPREISRPISATRMPPRISTATCCLTSTVEAHTSSAIMKFAL